MASQTQTPGNIDTAAFLAKQSRLHAQLDGLNRWLKQCGRDADERMREENDEAYLDASAQLRSMRKVRRARL